MSTTVSEIGADVRRWPRAHDSLHSMSDKARGNARDGGGMSPGTPRATYGRDDDDESSYSPVIWQGRLGSAAKGRLNTPRYPRERLMRPFAFALMMSLTAVTAASAQPSTPDSENGRYSFNPVAGG